MLEEKERHDELVKELNRTIEKSVLIRKIEAKSDESMNASPEQLEKIKLQLKAYREQIRLLDEE